MDMRIPPLKTKFMLESNPLKSRILVQRLALGQHTDKPCHCAGGAAAAARADATAAVGVGARGTHVQMNFCMQPEALRL